MAYVYKEEEGRSFLCYNDTDVRRVNGGEITGYPKLMFYVKDGKDLPGSVALDVREESRMDEIPEERSSEIDFFV